MYLLFGMCSAARETSGGGEEKLSSRKVLNPPSSMCKTSLAKCKREGKESRGLKDNGERDKSTDKRKERKTFRQQRRGLDRRGDKGTPLTNRARVK